MWRRVLSKSGRVLAGHASTHRAPKDRPSSRPLQPTSTGHVISTNQWDAPLLHPALRISQSQHLTHDAHSVPGGACAQHEPASGAVRTGSRQLFTKSARAGASRLVVMHKQHLGLAEPDLLEGGRFGDVGCRLARQHFAREIRYDLEVVWRRFVHENVVV